MSDDESAQPKYQIVRARFNDGDEVRLPSHIEVLHTERLDDGLEVWYRARLPLSEEDLTVPSHYSP